MDFDDGRRSAQREMKADRWTAEMARAYLDQCRAFGCENGRDDFDRGFMAEVRAKAGEV